MAEAPRSPAVEERLAEIQQRCKGWIPIAEWGPVCAGCGGGEYRIDGYCSVECRDFHSDDDVEWLAQQLSTLRAELEQAERALANVGVIAVREAIDYDWHEYAIADPFATESRVHKVMSEILDAIPDEAIPGAALTTPESEGGGG